MRPSFLPCWRQRLAGFLGAAALLCLFALIGFMASLGF